MSNAAHAGTSAVSLTFPDKNEPICSRLLENLMAQCESELGWAGWAGWVIPHIIGLALPQGVFRPQLERVAGARHEVRHHEHRGAAAVARGHPLARGRHRHQQVEVRRVPGLLRGPGADNLRGSVVNTITRLMGLSWSKWWYLN